VIFNTSSYALWPLTGSFGLLSLSAVFHWWLLKGCERYTRGELCRAFPDVARSVLIHRIVTSIAPIVASGLLLLGSIELLPQSTAAAYALLFLCVIPAASLRLILGLGLYSGGSINGIYYVRDNLPARKRSTLIAMQILQFVALLLACTFIRNTIRGA
jgi:hypothetical protein